MIKYLIDVCWFMKEFPCPDGNYKVWLRNCLYQNWQVPWKWNIDAYWLYKTIKRRIRISRAERAKRRRVMKCIDCDYHRVFPSTNNHWCEATKKHKRISDEDAYVDAPCKVGKRAEPTEPQTDWHYDEQDSTWYPYKHEDEPKTEPQKSCSTCGYSSQTPSCDTCEGYSNWWSLEDGTE